MTSSSKIHSSCSFLSFWSSSSFGSGPGSAVSLGIPTRLKDWICSYSHAPRTIYPLKETQVALPHRGARTVCVISVRGNVHMYTPDLIKGALLLFTMPCCSLGQQSSWRSLHVAIRSQSRAKTSQSQDKCSSVHDSEKMISYPIRYQERLSVRHGKEQSLWQKEVPSMTILRLQPGPTLRSI